MNQYNNTRTGSKINNTDAISDHERLGPSFVFSIIYLVVEYMRPQESYSFFMGWPLGQITLICILFSVLLENRVAIHHDRQNVYILTYLILFATSSIMAINPDLAWVALGDFTKLVIIYFLLTNILTGKKKLYVFLIVLILLNFKLAFFAARVWARTGFYSDPRGIFGGGGFGSSFFKNSNDFGAAMNAVIGLSYALIYVDKKKLFGWFNMQWFYVISFVSTVIAILSTSSRGATLGLGAVAVGIALKSKKRVISVVILVLGGALYLSLIPDDNWTRYQQIGSETDGTSQSRIKLMNAALRMGNEYPLTGVGPNNFIFVNQNIYRNELKEVQHNVFMQTLSELGYPGLVVFLLMIFHSFSSQKKSRKLLENAGKKDSVLYGLSHGIDLSLIGFLANGMFITVLYYPFFWILLILSTSLNQVVRHEVAIPGAGHVAG